MTVAATAFATPEEAAAAGYAAYRAWSSETLPDWDELDADMQRSWEFVALGYRPIEAVVQAPHRLRKPKAARAIGQSRRRPPVASPPTYRRPGRQMVYFIRAESGHIKIGISHHPKKRMWDLQTACPFELELIGAVRTADAASYEKAIHEYFAAHRVQGEWFRPDPEIESYIESLDLVRFP